tara:strand:- start:1320 stop:1559 length:240 start_codon:yes stop_codon:yes gene_type:complete
MTNRNVNEFTRIVHELKDEIFKGKKDATKANPIPFGSERVQSREEAVRLFEALPPAEKRAYIQQQGMDKMRDMLQGRKK